MSQNDTRIPVPVETVWSVLADPRQYDRFVVGTKRIRRFEPAWPDPGTALHHTLGAGPAVLRDATRVVDAEPPTVLRLHAGLGPLGVSEIVITIEPADSNQAHVTIEEHPIAGPLHAAWNPAFDGLMWLRNVELLRRLRRLAEHRAATTATGSRPRVDMPVVPAARDR